MTMSFTFTSILKLKKLLDLLLVLCHSNFPCGCGKSHQREKRVHFGSQFRVKTQHGAKSRQQVLEADGRVLCIVRKQRVVTAWAQLTFSFCIAGSQPRGWCHPQQDGLSTSVSSWKSPLQAFSEACLPGVSRSQQVDHQG